MNYVDSWLNIQHGQLDAPSHSGIGAAHLQQQQEQTLSDMPDAEPNLPFQDTIPPLLSLPLELFDMICTHLLPDDTSTYNRYHLFEYEKKFQRRQITKSFVNLAITSKLALCRCAETGPKSLKVAIGWKRYSETTNAQWGNAAQDEVVDSVCQELTSVLGRHVEYILTYPTT